MSNVFKYLTYAGLKLIPILLKNLVKIYHLQLIIVYASGRRRFKSV
jgi:hypothetical protein